MHNAFTIDVEDYFHTVAMSEKCPPESWAAMPARIESSADNLLKLLDDNHTKATFFVLGWVAERFPALIRRIADEKHELACHSYWHRPVFKLSREEFRKDTQAAKDLIEQRGAAKVLGYRAPSFSIIPSCAWAFEVLEDLGFLYDSSVNPIHHDIASNADAQRLPHRLRGSGIVELPVTTLRFASNNIPAGGGAYLRILPECLTSTAIKRMNEVELCPAVVYMHPWEIDPGQPRLQVKLKSRIRQYTGLEGMASRVNRLLQKFKFGPAKDVFKNIIEVQPEAELRRLHQSQVDREYGGII